MRPLDDFQKTGALLLDRGLVDIYSGALSVRNENGFVITRAGAPWKELADADLISCPLEGAIRDDVKPAMDAIVVQSVYQTNPSIQVIVRAHPVHAMALAASQSTLDFADIEGRSLLGSKLTVLTVVMDQFIAELHEKLPPLFEEGQKVVLVRGFGAYAAGPDLPSAIRLLSTLESSARLLWLSRGSSAPRPVSPSGSSQGYGGPRRPEHGHGPAAYTYKGSMGGQMGGRSDRKPSGFGGGGQRDYRGPRRFPR